MLYHAVCGLIESEAGVESYMLTELHNTEQGGTPIHRV